MTKRVVRALYDYSGGEESSLLFQKGDVIQVLTQLESGWWDGLCNGERGWFPSNYVSDVEVVTDAPAYEQPQSGPWVRQIGDRGVIYYYNRETGVTTAQVPYGIDMDDDDHQDSYTNTNGAMDLPEGWTIFESDTGGAVYYNTITKETRWTRPSNGEPNGGSDNDTLPTLSPASTAPISAGPLSPMTLSSASSYTRSKSGSISQSHQFEGLPPNWGKKTTAEGKTYFYNMFTDETAWSLDDVDLETGYLLSRLHLRHNSESSTVSDHSASSPTLNTNGDDSNRWSWNRLTSDIIQAIHALNQSAGRRNSKEKFIPQSSAIVESIRIMLYASGTARKDAPLVASYKPLKMHHRNIMSSLSKLVLSAKLASGVWPPPDAVGKMQMAANEVLLAIRHFVAAAQETGVEIVPGDLENGENNPFPAASSPSTPGGATAATAAAVEGNGTQASTQQTNSELIAQLERYTRSVVKMIAHMVHSVREDQCSSSMLITQVKSMVTEVGNFLALVDELPLDSLSEELSVDFKVNRLTLYNSISGLVMATQTATNPLAPSNAVEQVILSTGLVEKAVKDLLISTKFLIEEKESLEQLTLQNYIEQYGQQRRMSDVAVRPRRALSLSLLGSPGGHGSGLTSEPTNGGALSAPNSRYNVSGSSESTDNPGARPPPFGRSKSSSAVGDRPSQSQQSRQDSLGTIPDDEIDAAAERRPSKGSSKIQQILGAEAPPEQPPRKNSEVRPWYMEYDYSREDLVFNMEGKVKGGTLTALVERLTLHDSLDPDFTLTFLLTYRSYTNSIEFMDLLTQRFNIQPPQHLTAQEYDQWVEKKLTPVRLRVFNIIKTWLETYCSDEDPMDRQALALLKDFANIHMQPTMSFASQQIIRIIEKRDAGRGTARKMVMNPGRDYPTPILPRNLNRIKFLELDATEVARQLTILESKLYNKIQPVEFLRKAWSEKEGSIAVNVKTMIVMSNQNLTDLCSLKITGWVASSILLEKDIKKRAQIMKQFILIADRCRSMNNFNTLMSVLAGLNSAPIHRLKRTWDLLSARSHAALDNLRKTMNPTKNFSHYRESLHSANPPCVPFLGFYLTDLTFVEDGNLDTLTVKASGGKSGLINFSKHMKTAEVIREIQQYQNAPYVLMPVPELQQWLRSSLDGRVEDADLYNISLSMEPREREDEKIARLLQESGFL
ncbi:ras guanine nucleotide exchange factor domain-containing protein [Phlyctochytrium arcticum]|nr:ras guanine nucleotide exchange factor domain-containing protein [Phlyctochytrium arcticum]